MCGRCGTSSMTTTCASGARSLLGGYQGERQATSSTRSEPAASETSPPRCMGWSLGKFAQIADCGSITGIASSSASSTSARNASGSRPADSVRITGLAGVGEPGRDCLDLCGWAQSRPAGRDFLAHLGRLPRRQQRLEADVQIHGAGRLPLCELAGADHRLVQGRHVRDVSGPLGEGRGDDVRAADEGEVAVPLRPRVGAVALAVGDRLGGGDKHRRARQQRAVDGVTSLQQTGHRVQEHRREPPLGQPVAGGHRDGERLVCQVVVRRTFRTVTALAGECLPGRCPLRPRRGEDVLDLEGAKRLEQRLATIDRVGHRCVRR